MKTTSLHAATLILSIVVIFTLMLLVYYSFKPLPLTSKKQECFIKLRQITMAMMSYSSSDVRFRRMPYPVPKGSVDMLPKWGESRDCWSPEVIKLLFKTGYLLKGDEKNLVSGFEYGRSGKPMLLSEDIKAKGNVSKMRWKTNSELHFHIYCAPNLTDAVSGNMIIGITYDQPNINDCLFDGEGWSIVRLDGSGGFKKRKFYGQYDFDNKGNNLLDSMAKTKGLKAMHAIDPKATLKKVFGVNGNGGSTEIIGCKSSSVVFKVYSEAIIPIYQPVKSE